MPYPVSLFEMSSLSVMDSEQDGPKLAHYYAMLLECVLFCLEAIMRYEIVLFFGEQDVCAQLA